MPNRTIAPGVLRPYTLDDITFLIVDDDTISVMALTRAMRRLSLENPVRTAKHGEEALAILRGEDGHEKLSQPYIILLDINMPRMDGLEFLDVLRADPQLSESVVFMLTTSDAPADVAAAYSKCVAGYVRKEEARESLASTLEMLGLYGRVVTLPAFG